MARIGIQLTDPQKAAVKAFCSNNRTTVTALLLRVFKQLLGDSFPSNTDKKTSFVVREGSNNFTLRMRGSELRMIEKRAEEEGFSFRTSWAVSVLRQALSSVPIVTRDEVKAIRESNRELAAIGRNLNQVAHAINIDPRNEDRLTPELFEELQDQLEAHHAKVSTLLDLALNRWGVMNE